MLKFNKLPFSRYDFFAITSVVLGQGQIFPMCVCKLLSWVSVLSLESQHYYNNPGKHKLEGHF